MGRIEISSQPPAGMWITHEFLDNHMPQASGDFVKIYLYFLRWSGCTDSIISLSSAADTFCMTENDIVRALKYWEKQGLIRLTVTNDQISALAFLSSEAEIRDTHLPKSASSQTAPSAHTAATPSCSAAGQQPADESDKAKPSYSMQQIYNFKQQNDGDRLFFVIQKYLKKNLGPTDINTIVYFHEGLGFSCDLIEYLFEYCVSNDHYSMHYIEQVALSWEQENIQTVSQAKASCAYFNKTFFAVLKAFGIRNRNPVEAEVTYIRRWTRQYGFPMKLVLEACSRTMKQIHTPSFDYADKILTDWYNNKVGSMADVEKLDQRHAARAERAAHSSSGSGSDQPPKNGAPRTANKFHNFNQRSYDYSELEQSLVNKIRQKASQEQQ